MPLTAQGEQEAETAGNTGTGSTEGKTTRLPSRAGGARFTGASASLKVVSGASALGTTETKTATTNRKRTDIQRSRFTARITPSAFKLLRQFSLVNPASGLQKPHLARRIALRAASLHQF